LHNPRHAIRNIIDTGTFSHSLAEQQSLLWTLVGIEGRDPIQADGFALGCGDYLVLLQREPETGDEVDMPAAGTTGSSQWPSVPVRWESRACRRAV
jgi:hypothetical protein